MRALFVATFVMACGGCCCPGAEFTDHEEWKHAVQRETANPQLYSLEAGTANVFEVEIKYPRGWTQELEDAAAERAAQREVVRLQQLLAANGVDAGTQLKVAAVTAQPLELSLVVRFVLVHPSASQERDSYQGADCKPCAREAIANHAVLMRSSGFSPVDLQTVTHEQLVAGVELHGHFSVGSASESNTISLAAPPEGRATVRLVESCKAKVLRVEKKLNAGNGGGVIAVPNYVEHAWYELREAPCAGDGTTTRNLVGPQFVSGESTPPSLRRAWELRQQLDQLGIAH